MFDGRRTQLAHALRHRLWLPAAAMTAAALTGVAAASIIGVAAAGHSTLVGDASATPEPTLQPGDASALAGFGLAPQFTVTDGAAFDAIVTFARIAGQPTPTAVPPTPAPPQPTATARPPVV